MRAEDAAHVQQQLQSMGYQATVIEQSKSSARFTQTRVPASKVRLNRRSRGLFYRSLATTFKSGMNISEAMTIIARNTPNPRVRELCLGLKQYVDAGKSFSEAMEHFPGVFGEWQVGVFRAGETGGFIDEVAHKIALEYEKRGWFFEFFCNALWVSLVTNVFIAVLAIPLFPIIFRGDNPIVAYLSEVKNHLFTKGILCITPFVVLKVVTSTQRAKGWYQKISHRLPMVAELHCVATLADFSEMLERLLRAGIAPIQAWESAYGAVKSVQLRPALARGTECLKKGKGLSDAFKATGLPDPETAGYIATAEMSGRIFDALVHMTENLRLQEKQIRIKLDQLRLHSLIAANLAVAGVIFVAWAYNVRGIFDFVDKMMSQ